MQAQQEAEEPDKKVPVGVGVDFVLHRDEGGGLNGGRPNDDEREVDEAGHDPGDGEGDKERGRRDGPPRVAGQFGGFQEDVVDVVGQKDEGADAREAGRGKEGRG